MLEKSHVITLPFSLYVASINHNSSPKPGARAYGLNINAMQCEMEVTTNRMFLERYRDRIAGSSACLNGLPLPAATGRRMCGRDGELSE